MTPASTPRSVLRLTTPGQNAFQLRKGEEGISVFEPSAVNPPLTEDEVLAAFAPGSQVLSRTAGEIESLGLQIIPIEGADVLPDRLRRAHHEIRPGPGMSRDEFKKALREL